MQPPVDRLQVMPMRGANNGRNSILERLSVSLINCDLATALSFEVCALYRQRCKQGARRATVTLDRPFACATRPLTAAWGRQPSAFR
jgi:hypothetical protein